MIITAKTISDKPAQRRYYRELMDLYEANYMRLRRLIPDFNDLGIHAISVVSGGLDLHYQLLEKCKYTNTFSLSYIFVKDTGAMEQSHHRAPDLQIRFYEDAKLAEVISGVLHKHYLSSDKRYCSRLSDALVQPDMCGIYARWRLNRFLYRWLGLCLKQGHLFQRPESCEQIQRRLLRRPG